MNTAELEESDLELLQRAFKTRWHIAVNEAHRVRTFLKNPSVALGGIALKDAVLTGDKSPALCRVAVLTLDELKVKHGVRSLSMIRPFRDFYEGPNLFPEFPEVLLDMWVTCHGLRGVELRSALVQLSRVEPCQWARDAVLTFADELPQVLFRARLSCEVARRRYHPWPEASK